MSDTPETDAEAGRRLKAATIGGKLEIDPMQCVRADFARELELENAYLLAALESINNVSRCYPYAGNACGEIARSVLAKVLAKAK